MKHIAQAQPHDGMGEEQTGAEKALADCAQCGEEAARFGADPDLPRAPVLTLPSTAGLCRSHEVVR